MLIIYNIYSKCERNISKNNNITRIFIKIYWKMPKKLFYKLDF